MNYCKNYFEYFSKALLLELEKKLELEMKLELELEKNSF